MDGQLRHLHTAPSATTATGAATATANARVPERRRELSGLYPILPEWRAGLADLFGQSSCRLRERCTQSTGLHAAGLRRPCADVAELHSAAAGLSESCAHVAELHAHAPATTPATDAELLFGGPGRNAGTSLPPGQRV